MRGRERGIKRDRACERVCEESGRWGGGKREREREREREKERERQLFDWLVLYCLGKGSQTPLRVHRMSPIYSTV